VDPRLDRVLSVTDAVVVVGSGAAGLSAAIAARSTGADVTVLESTEFVGGTTALSGGVAWVPVNHVEAVGEGRDSREQARDYLQSLALGDADLELIERFIAQAGEAARWIEENSALEWELLPYPDYHCEMPGGMTVGGRSLSACLVTPREDVASILRPALSWRAPVTHLEVVSNSIDPEVIAQRREDGTVTMGQAMIAALATTCIDEGIDVRTQTRAISLVEADGAVTGLVAEGPEGRETFEGRVVLASGGFERDPQFARAFLRIPEPAQTGAPGARGDGLRMAMSAGAALGNMSEAWWAPTISIPGDEISGQPLYRLILNERSRPGSLMVDAVGRRFVNESQNYNDVGRTMHSFDARSYSFDRLESWLVFDQTYRSSYLVGPVMPSDPDPEFFCKANSISELAEQMGVDPSVLEDTVEEFNAGARQGRDRRFQRGETAYDQALGDPEAGHPNLRELVDGPFFAVRVHAGTLGTKGGPRIDGDGRVQHVQGGAIPGLYAAGNVSASFLGLAYPGAGGTLGPAITVGVLAGRAAATDSPLPRE
jgi:3-oxosteroid 1-dehydrogenase